jgi:hypothetical protein
MRRCIIGLTKDRVRDDLRTFLRYINEDKDKKELFAYLIATGKFECTFRDLFAQYLQKQKKYSKKYLVLLEHSVKSKSVDICFLNHNSNNVSMPVLIIEIKHCCSFNSGGFKRYIKKYLDERLRDVAPKKVIKVGIVLINHIDASLETLGNCERKQYKYFASYLSRKKKVKSISGNLNDIKEEIKNTDYTLLEDSIVKGTFKFNDVDKVNTELLVLINK